MGRIKSGWLLTKKAWGVVRENPGLMKLPVYGALVALLVWAVIGIPGLLMFDPNAANAADSSNILGGVLIAIAAYLGSFAIIYFNVALAAAADLAFRGQPADPSAGLAVARQRRGVIAQWAAVSMVISLIFSLIRDRGGIAGQIAAGLGAALWALITFLIAPVLAFEGLGPLAAIKRSSSMFKQKWGQQITGNIAISAVTGLAMIVSVVVGAAGGYILLTGSTAAAALGGGLLLLGLVGVIISAVVSGAVRGVFGVALYRYIADGQPVGPFTIAELESSVKPKKGAPATGV